MNSVGRTEVIRVPEVARGPPVDQTICVFEIQHHETISYKKHLDLKLDLEKSRALADNARKKLFIFKPVAQVARARFHLNQTEHVTGCTN